MHVHALKDKNHIIFKVFRVGMLFCYTYQNSDPAWRIQETGVSEANHKSIHHTKHEKDQGYESLGNRECHQASFVQTFHYATGFVKFQKIPLPCLGVFLYLRVMYQVAHAILNNICCLHHQGNVKRPST